jgi:uncharacterized protein YndB with AHSA1/START domain
MRKVTHGTFTLERTYDASPERVFNAFADPKQKAEWFRGPAEWTPPEQTHDFRVGGVETSRGGPKGGFVTYFEARYQDIIPNERIIYTYFMHFDGALMSVSLCTIELTPQGRGTKLTMTEAGAYLDEHADHNANRRQGTEGLLEALGRFVEKR